MGYIFHIDSHHGYFYWKPLLYTIVIVSAAITATICVLTGNFITSIFPILIVIINIRPLIFHLRWLFKMNRIKIK